MENTEPPKITSDEKKDPKRVAMGKKLSKMHKKKRKSPKSTPINYGLIIFVVGTVATVGVIYLVFFRVSNTTLPDKPKDEVLPKIYEDRGNVAETCLDNLD